MSKQRGFTLIEVMVVLVIITIIAAVGYPSYTEYVNRGKRAEGKGALLRAAQQMERYYTLTNCYPDNTATCSTRASCGGNASTSALALCHADIRDFSGDSAANSRYTISVTTTPQAFTLTATPNYTDTKCGTLTLTNTNVKGESGTDTVANCWSK
jgi:type IV pilus assembly protein PilE